MVNSKADTYQKAKRTQHCHKHDTTATHTMPQTRMEGAEKT